MTKNEAKQALEEHYAILMNSVAWFEVVDERTFYSFYDVCHALMVCPHCVSGPLHDEGITQIAITTSRGGNTIIPVLTEAAIYWLIANTQTPVTMQLQEWYRICTIPPDDDEEFLKLIAGD